MKEIEFGDVHVYTEDGMVWIDTDIYGNCFHSEDEIIEMVKKLAVDQSLVIKAVFYSRTDSNIRFSLDKNFEFMYCNEEFYFMYCR